MTDVKLASGPTSAPRTRALGFVLFALALSAYWEVRRCDFINLDDSIYVYENPYVRRGVTLEGLKWAFGAELLFVSPYADYWIPLTQLSRMLDVELFGLNPAGHHLVNVLLHAVNVLLLFLVLTRWTRGLWRSAFVAALFAVHPMHVESVAWVTERKDVLSALFWMLALWAYARYREKPGVGRYLGVAACYVAGLMSKPMAMTLPCVLLLLDVWPLRRVRPESLLEKRGWAELRQPVVEKIPLFALMALALGATVAAAKSCGAVSFVGGPAPLQRLGNAAACYGAYLAKLVWPANLAVVYPYAGDAAWWEVGGAVLLLAAITVAGAMTVRERPWLVVGWLWFLGVLFPVSGVVQVGPQAIADRFVYIPFIGLYVMIVWTAAELAERRPRWRRPLAAVGGAAVAALLVATWGEVRYWRNSETLLRRATEVTEDNYLAHHNLGVALVEQGRPQEAVGHYRRSITIKSDFPDAYVNLGVALQRMGRLDEAMAQYRRGLMFQPDDPEAHMNLGVALTEKGRLQEATAHFGKALAADPLDAETHFNCANALRLAGKVDEAALHYRRAVAFEPGYAEAYINLGATLLAAGRAAEAVRELRQAVSVNPTAVEALVNLANALKMQGQLDEALQFYARALALRPGQPEVHNELGAAFAMKGAWDRAERHFAEACRQDPALVQARVNLARVLASQGKTQEAVRQYQQALGSRPDWPPPMVELAWLYAAHPDPGTRNPAAAVVLAEKLCGIAGDESPQALDLLAAAYAAAARFPDAVRTAERATALAAAAAAKPLADAIDQRLALYRQGKPFRSGPSGPGG